MDSPWILNGFPIDFKWIPQWGVAVFSLHLQWIWREFQLLLNEFSKDLERNFNCFSMDLGKVLTFGTLVLPVICHIVH